MDEIRALALDHAVTIATLVKTDRIDAQEVVAAAEAFRRFLAGDVDQPTSTGETASTGTIQPPPLPAPTWLPTPADEMLLSREVEGLARADQSPDDDTKTRLIRPGTEVP